MTHEYKLLHGDIEETLNKRVNEHLADGWELWGNAFFAGFTSVCQAVVRFDPSGHAVIGKAETALREPAGYSVGVPETPGEQAGPTVEVPILPEFQTGPIVRCTCLEYWGDNPDCRVHNGGPIGFGRIC